MRSGSFSDEVFVVVASGWGPWHSPTARRLVHDVHHFEGPLAGVARWSRRYGGEGGPGRRRRHAIHGGRGPAADARAAPRGDGWRPCTPTWSCSSRTAWAAPCRWSFAARRPSLRPPRHCWASGERRLRALGTDPTLTLVVIPGPDWRLDRPDRRDAPGRRYPGRPGSRDAARHAKTSAVSGGGLRRSGGERIGR